MGTVLGGDGAFDGMVGESLVMRRLFERIERVAGLDVPVLIQGETGTGKELVARAIHGRSRRCRGPFVAVNCAAVPATLVESEFFGHARGAFTDAREARRGRFEEAHGGTLFLDEVGDMPAEVQPKFLRALQDGEIAPLGAARPIPVDVRLVCATNRDLRAAAASGAFRLDLFFRIAGLIVSVPPLRDRAGDVPALARHLLHQVGSSSGVACAGIAHEALAVLAAYDWPGNIRELEAVVLEAALAAHGRDIHVEDLPTLVRERLPVLADPTASPGDLNLHRHTATVVEDLERRLIRTALCECRSHADAARVLGIDVKTLYAKRKKYGLSSC
jgi:transcriptional regulator with GAF, ATPase, and Fis domain